MTNFDDLNVSIIGGGRMGSGIAFIFANAGFNVKVFEPNAQYRSDILSKIDGFCDLLDVGRGAVSKVSLPETIEQAAKQASIIIEAAPENLAIKQDIFARLDEYAPANCILATNTSALPIAKIAAKVKGASRVVGTHFWNPPHLIELVEVILSESTDPDVAQATMDILASVGMTPVLVRKDIPGFIGNRLQHALKREAIALVAEGVCDAKTLDTVVKLGFGARLPIMGPLEQSDLLGLELTMAIHETLMPDLDTTQEPHPYLRQKINDGETGAKVGVGFREWSQDEADAARQSLSQFLVEAAKIRYKGKSTQQDFLK